MSKLFMVYLGGSAPKANIELHDVQFIVADRIEDSYEQLKSNWFGNIGGLHIDSYIEIRGADGYSIILQDEPQMSENHLYFVNLGGYRNDKLYELHEFALFVASSETEAKNRAKDGLLKTASHKHKDNLVEVDDCLRVGSVDGKFIHLQKSDEAFDLRPDWFGYKLIG